VNGRRVGVKLQHRQQYLISMNTLNGFIQHLRRGTRSLDDAGPTDGELMAAYVARHDPAAFEALVRRHGPMVLGVCRRILRNDADAEDAFQATFLVLVRKAGTLKAKSMVSNWLYGVAHNTALKAKAMDQQRRAKEREAGALSKEQAGEEVWQQAQALLDEAVRGLPDRYRVAIVLCDLEGKTVKEAARQLACPQGTVATRLSRGRALLARRLSRRGLALSAGAVAAVLREGAASASVPASLVGATMQAASVVAAGHAGTGIISAKVVALWEGVLKAMLLAKLKAASAVLMMGAFAVAIALLTLPVEAAQPAARGSQGKADAPKKKAGSGDHPKEGEKAESKPTSEVAVMVQADLYEVDDAFYKKLSNAKRLSKADLEKLERQIIGPPGAKQPEGETLFKLLGKQRLLLTGKEVQLDIGKEGMVLVRKKAIKCLPSPDQLRKGQNGPQTVEEGVSLFAQAHLSADRRFVLAKLTEKSAELEDIEKVTVLDNTGKEVLANIPFLKESSHSQMRDIPDGGSFLLPLHYRSREARNKDRWLVVRITPRIYIAEEEERIRGQAPR
jgi:RNA polymerase sigma factor (sigma-70 family)